MKKIATLIIAFSIITVTMSSCKSSAKCPAYGKVKVENNTKRA
jgi:hypothetical protein